METKPAAALHSSDEIEFEFEFMPFRKYKDGRIERLEGEDFVPPSDNLNGVSSKDIILDPDTGLSARLYLPLAVLEEVKQQGIGKRFPVLVYFHGGGFCLNTPFCALHHYYLNSVVSQASVVAISIHYRRATEHLLPAAYDDCWAGLQWVLSHRAAAPGPDAWLTAHGDLGRVYLAGDSAAANIAHNIAIRLGEEGIRDGTQALEGIVLVHPYFWGTERLPEEVEKIKPEWLAKVDQVWPMVSGLENDHPWINATADGAPSLARLGCRKVLVVVAAEDILRARGVLYYDRLRQSGYAGVAELWETPGEFHVFHLYNPGSDKAKELMNKLAAFLNGM